MAIEGLKRRATVSDWIVSPNANIVIDGGRAADGDVEGMVEPGHSKNGGKYFDLEDGDSMGAASTAAWRQPSQAATRSSCGGLSPRGPPRCSRCRRPRPPGHEKVKVRVEVGEKGMRREV